MSSRKLDDLSDRFRPQAFELLARFVENGLQVKIIETTRTQAEHQANVAKGVSWTSHSKHQDGDAIDVAPLSVLPYPDWLPDDAQWLQMGLIAEDIGLTWGGRWNRRDPCHFEYKTSSPIQETDKTSEQPEQARSWFKRIFS